MPKPRPKVIFVPGGMGLAVSDIQLDLGQNNRTSSSTSSPDVLPHHQSSSPFAMFTGRKSRPNASSSTEEKSDKESVKESTPPPPPSSVSQQGRRQEQIVPPKSICKRRANVPMNSDDNDAAEEFYYEDCSRAAGSSLRTLTLADDFGRSVSIEDGPNINPKTAPSRSAASGDNNTARSGTDERRRQASPLEEESGLYLPRRNNGNPNDDRAEGLYYEDRSRAIGSSLGTVTLIDDFGRPVRTRNGPIIKPKTVRDTPGTSVDKNTAGNATDERQRQSSTSENESGLQPPRRQNASVAMNPNNDTADGLNYEDCSGAASSSLRTDNLGRLVRMPNGPDTNPETVSEKSVASADENTASNATDYRRKQGGTSEDESGVRPPRRIGVTQGHNLARFRNTKQRPDGDSAFEVGNKNPNSQRIFQNTRIEQNTSSSFEADTQPEMSSRQKFCPNVNKESSVAQKDSDSWPINSATANENDDVGSDWEVESYSSHHPSNYLKYTGKMMTARLTNISNFPARHEEMRPKYSGKPQSTVQSRMQQGEPNGVLPNRRHFPNNNNNNGESNNPHHQNHPLAGTSQRNSITPKASIESVSDYYEEDESTSIESSSGTSQISTIENDLPVQKLATNNNNHFEPITANSGNTNHFNSHLPKSDASFAHSYGFPFVIASSSTPKILFQRPKQNSPSREIEDEKDNNACQKSTNNKFDEESSNSENSDSTGKNIATTRKTVNYRAAMFSRILRERQAENTNKDDVQTTIIFDASVSQEDSSLEQEDQPEFCRCSTESDCNKWCTCPAWRARHLKFDPAAPSDLFLLKKPRPQDEETGAVPKVVEIDKKIVQNTLFHGTVIPKPAKTTADISFDDGIRGKLDKLKCAHPTVIQAHMWPACLRRMNMCMVGGKRTGKTLAYLPALCTFIVARKEFYRDLAEYEGPLIVILCNSPGKAIKLYAAMDTLLEGVQEDKPGVEVITQSMSGEDDLNKYDVLITTPPLLENCLRESQLSLKRLCHLVIENADIILRENPRLMENLFSVVDEIQNKRPQYIRIQVVAVSETWSANLENLCTHLQSPPLICVSDALEAAFYSKIQFSRKMLKTQFKMFYLEDLLTGKFSDHRTIVFCDESEIPDLQERLTLKGIENLTITSEMSYEDVVENHESWTRLRCGQFRVLLCSDEGFKRLRKVGPASWLVHYKLPEKWLTFVLRFQCLIENFKNSPYDTEKQAIFCHSFVVIEGESQVSERFFEVLAKNIIGNFLVTKMDDK